MTRVCADVPLADHPSKRTDNSGRRPHVARSGHVCRASDPLGPERRFWLPCAHSRHPPSRFETCLCPPCDRSRQRQRLHRCTTLCTALRRPGQWPALTRSQGEQSGTPEPSTDVRQELRHRFETLNRRKSLIIGIGARKSQWVARFCRWVPKISPCREATRESPRVLRDRTRRRPRFARALETREAPNPGH